MHSKINKILLIVSVTLIFLIYCFDTVNSQDLKEKAKNEPKSEPNSLFLKEFSGINFDAYDVLKQVQTQTNYQGAPVPVEGIVDQDKYIIGQGDNFVLGIYGYVNQSIPLVVTLEGTLNIPTIGSIKVDGMTLREAKKNVTSSVKKRYYSSDVSLSLATPRVFLINISGITQGTYSVTPLTRPSQIVELILADTTKTAKFLERSFPRQKDLLAPDISFRNIKLIRKNGDIIRVDIYKFFMTREDKFNPYLREGDVLEIPVTLLRKSYISVSGAVRMGGTYEYTPEDDLETVIGLGRGLDVSAEPDSILIYRPQSDSRGFEIINLSYEKDKYFKINNFDRVFVKYKNDLIVNSSVLVLGEVRSPGFYPITFKNTKLKDVIEMAGGITDKAYLPLSILFRNYDHEYLARDTIEIMINQRANDLLISEKDIKNFQTDILSKRNRVNVDFVRLMDEKDSISNIILEDKDIIYINDDKKVVYVYGQVMSEGYVPYIAGKNIDFYIERAGGFSLAADKSNARLIRFNSRGWYDPDDSQVMSGDFIYVPKKTPQEFKDIVTVVSQIAAVILGVLTTYILIKQNSK